MGQALPVGTRVGAGRWPNVGNHPDCWEVPHGGVVIAENDPRAWANTLAFPEHTPTVEAVDAHLARLTERICDTPVLWDFGKVYWEAEIRPYDEDFAAWEKFRADEYAKLSKDDGIYLDDLTVDGIPFDKEALEKAFDRNHRNRPTIPVKSLPTRKNDTR